MKIWSEDLTIKFKDKVAIIAGSTLGLGKEIAKDLAPEGARFVTGEILDVNGGLPMDLHAWKWYSSSNINVGSCDS